MSLAGLARAALLALCAAVVFSGCSESLPTPPTVPANQDVTGRWAWLDANGRTTRTWMLVQHGTAVEGTNLVDPATDVSYTDSVNGSVTGTEFTFSATTTQYFPSGPQESRMDGTMTITAGTMSGMVTSLAHIGKINSFRLTMVRVVQGQ